MLPSLSLPPLECCLGTSPIQAEKLRPEFRVKLRRTQYEHVFSALPSNSDIARRGRHVSKVPNRKCLASQVWPLTQGFGPVGYSTEPLVSYQINRHGSAWSQCRDDCRRSIAAKIRKARREQPSRVASVRQDPNSAALDALPIFRTVSHRQRFPSTMGSGRTMPQLTDRW